MALKPKSVFIIFIVVSGALDAIHYSHSFALEKFVAFSLCNSVALFDKVVFNRYSKFELNDSSLMICLAHAYSFIFVVDIILIRSIFIHTLVLSIMIHAEY